ncbi:hypothetical protein [Streptomyces sp. A012304]|uniref:hypothetical protein n=1 Tax=Streptomyces sp. A012304 TaxID=375446 RepID=UPI002231300B|nr:hypothetical protein [Streptomyces sp. A012304]GKQ34423.1 hypothetical protein ALMP_09730 [Streptomyces sp. A012304]
MSHRGRKLAALFITLFVLGLVLNNIAGRTRASEEAAAEAAKAAAPAARPLAPLYVPRPASMIGGYGGALTPQSSPQEVAQAFAGVYIKYDPDSNSPDSFVPGLPRLASDASDKVSAQLSADWDKHLSKIGDSVTVTSVSDPGAADVEAGKVKVSVVMNTGEDSEALRLDLELEQEEVGWVVTSVTLDGA